MAELLKLDIDVPARLAGHRLDQAAAELIPDYSRARLQSWIKGGQLTVDGNTAKPKDKLFGGERLRLRAELEPQGEWRPQALDLQVVFEDDSLLVINKPAGLVVHPAAGNPDGTLLNGLLHYCPALERVPRAGIVHRLDKDTSGLMVVAKTLPAQTSLVQQLKARTVSRQYDALAQGAISGGGTVDAPIGRHRQNRLKMAVLDFGGKEAITHYRVRERFRTHTLLRCALATGRTHQIRVHMAYIRHPLVGDPLYGGRPRLPPEASPELARALQQFPRQALHAAELCLRHPRSDEEMRWRAPIPADMLRLLELLREDAGTASAADGIGI
ncbi:23S rRNA pseudouridine(1911/1915/1917) synthase RluD [Microbulbifer thermotolerans]|uniref:Pseudouridine synthase n=1 Tax=Microbulbifer thermotolerans TaxID=252514 RepID=A0A143HJG1_MICTH|nr:23S rRNA pseudouridine(1911/1915/1917) synthase RluD [Microbulbifer thermotolerans]AMX01651.1 RNA pseudouridine synthase [Microbulbifer thermotolerans]MCX2780257.1 23S rRNA pseudouridine(1911/1915/1917) synthase RluD [Microbulbifer thermotolerans]MCX2795918.1 23S rRNA pseudouridine(1911/1915/1917) synthase RluD [Microbulbifer thermotolerans]MCX2805789.1 23S rRNA pseudouridine(1911/1915/1917) synthase RluD [Microbulbifer thermotolerans]MCX2832529.1 23S rRNA pseudouridine(1911/1915/1917) synt